MAKPWDQNIGTAHPSTRILKLPKSTPRALVTSPGVASCAAPSRIGVPDTLITTLLNRAAASPQGAVVSTEPSTAVVIVCARMDEFENAFAARLVSATTRIVLLPNWVADVIDAKSLITLPAVTTEPLMLL